MSNLLATFYLGILLTGLTITLYFLLVQINKKQNLENNLTRLRKRVEADEAGPKDYYALGSIYLSKKLFDQAVLNFSHSLKEWDKSDLEGLSTLYNAIGFTYFESGQTDMSIYYYQEAINIKPSYITALNNLGFSYEKKRMFGKAQETYEKVLAYDSYNSIANQKLQLIRKKSKTSG